MPFIISDGVRVFYKKNKKEAFFVFLHGAGSNHSIYSYLDNFNYIAPDLRGHGFSDDGDVRVKKLVDDLERIIKREKLRDFVIVGNSASCCIAIELYKKLGDKIKAVVMISPFSRNTTRFSFFLYLLFLTLEKIFFWKKRKKIFVDYSKRRGNLARFLYELYIMNLKNYFRICKEAIKYRIDFDFAIPCYVCIGKKDFIVRRLRLKLVARKKKNVKLVFFNSDHLIVGKCKKEFERFLNKIIENVKNK